ncbi:hypothetical protein CFIMG_003183RAa, partial [Ceratocystis fimbriata CBS 114723]
MGPALALGCIDILPCPAPPPGCQMRHLLYCLCLLVLPSPSRLCCWKRRS